MVLPGATSIVGLAADDHLGIERRRRRRIASRPSRLRAAKAVHIERSNGTSIGATISS
jgi:hypothetical protein